MDSVFIGISKRDILAEIKDRIDALHYTECLVCGGIKVDAMELARTLDIMCNEHLESEDDNEVEVYEYLDKLLYKIIEPEPNFNEIDDWSKWSQTNRMRLCSFLNGYDYAMYITCDEVVLVPHLSCGCFKEVKSKGGLLI